MSFTDQILLCEFCGEKTIHTNPCQFCSRIVCSKEARYLPSKEETIQGIRTKVVRVCPDCVPRAV